MEPLPLYLLAGISLLALIAVWRAQSRSLIRRAMPFARRPWLLTPAELTLYRALLQSAPPGTAVFAKVRLLDVVSLPEVAWRRYGEPASALHVDFLLVDAATTFPRLVVELDNGARRTPERRRQEAFKSAALASASLPVLRVNANGRHDASVLRPRVRAALAA